MAVHKGELDAPRDALLTTESTEVVRVWVLGDRLQISFRPTVFEDCTTWGILAMDLLRHVAEGLQQEGFGSMEDNLKVMKETFENEWKEPYTGVTKNTFDA